MKRGQRTPRRHVATLALLLALGLPLRAAAEPGTSSADVGLFLGGQYVADESELGNSFFRDQVPESGPLLGLRGAYVLFDGLAPSSALAPRIGIEVEAKLTFSSTPGNPDFGRSPYNAQLLGWRTHARLDLRRSAKWSPFALVGVGGETLFSSSPHLNSGDTDFQFHWGVGAVYEIVPRYGVRVDLRHTVAAARTGSATSGAEVHMGFVYELAGGARTEPQVGKKLLAAGQNE